MKWPTTMASQTSDGSRVPNDWNTAHSPSGRSPETLFEIYKGLRVSPVPCSPPV